MQGHVDGVGEVTAVSEDGFARRLAIALPDGLERYVVEHGSITVAGREPDRVGRCSTDGLEVSLIPETLERTTLGAASPARR